MDIVNLPVCTYARVIIINIIYYPYTYLVQQYYYTYIDIDDRPLFPTPSSDLSDTRDETH